MMSAQLKNLGSVFVALLLFLAIRVSTVQAVGSCTATANPSSVQTNSIEYAFSFSVTNTGPDPITIIKLTRPSSNFTLVNYGVSGWKVIANETTANIYNNSIAAGDTLNFNFNATTGSTEAAAADWSIVTNDGSGDVACTGSLGTAIVGQGDITAPELTELTVTNITDSAATINWTTNEASTSHIDYGPIEGEPDSTADSTSLVTSHSLTLTGLSSGTLYHFSASSVDASGNTGVNSQNTFTTASESSSGTSTTTTTTATPTPTPTPSPTPPPVDRTPPRVVVDTAFDTPFEITPLVTGKATDNEYLSSIEYSTDGGKNWLPVDTLDFQSFTRADYEFTPLLYDDGNYDIQVRAKDKRGNIGKSSLQTLVIDRLPPRIGGNVTSLGPLILMPDASGTLIATTGLQQKISLSAVGGPTEIELYINDETTPLSYSPETNLWSGFLNLNTPGTYTLTAKAVDGANNTTKRDLNQIEVIKSGTITNQYSETITNGTITIFAKDHTTQLWNQWDAQAFSQDNPLEITDQGTYQFFLPPGTYYMQVESPGYQTLKSQIFSIYQSQPINADLTLKPGKVLQIGKIKIGLPSFLQNNFTVNVSLATSNNQSTSELIGKTAPDINLESNGETFRLSDLRGETSIISFVNTWSPLAVEQISIVNDMGLQADQIALITTQESSAKIKIFQQRGNYDKQIWSDPDGELVKSYQLTSLPTHFVIDRRGTIKQIITQVLTKEQLLNLLSSTD